MDKNDIKEITSMQREERVSDLRRKLRDDYFLQKRMKLLEINEQQYSLEQIQNDAIQKDLDTKLKALKALFKLFSENDQFEVQKVVDLNITYNLIQNLHQNSEELNLISVKILGVILSGTEQHVKSVVDKGIIPILMIKLNTCIQTNDKLMIEQLFIAITYVVGENIIYRNQFLKHGLFNEIIQCLDAFTEDESIIQYLVQTLASISSYKIEICQQYMYKGISIFMFILRKFENLTIIHECCQGLYHLTVHLIIKNETQYQLDLFLSQFQENYIIQTLLKIFEQKNEQTLQYGLKLSLILLEKDPQFPLLLSQVESLFEKINFLTQHHNNQVRYLCLKIIIFLAKYNVNKFKICQIFIQNIEKQNYNQITEIIQIISNCFINMPEFQIKKIINETDLLYQLKYLIKQKNSSILPFILEIYDKILQYDKSTIKLEDQYLIEQLQEHPDDLVYQKAFNILKQHFKCQFVGEKI